MTAIEIISTGIAAVVIVARLAMVVRGVAVQQAQ